MGHGNGCCNVIISFDELIEVVQFYCLVVIEFVMLHCKNVSWVFPILLGA